jgi:hypothetical protein
MSRKIRNAGDNSGSPMLNNLLRLVGEHLSSKLQVTLVLLPKTGAS